MSGQQQQQQQQSERSMTGKTVTVLSYSANRNYMDTSDMSASSATLLTTTTIIERNDQSETGAKPNDENDNEDEKAEDDDDDDDYKRANKLSGVIASNQLELHKYVYADDAAKVRAYIDSHRQRLQQQQQQQESTVAEQQLSDYVSIRDMHGNTPLHLAAMLGRLECARLLIDAGAVCKARNKQMWTPLNEAVSYGNRELIKLILDKLEKETDVVISASKPQISSALHEMADFYVEIKWDFESWLPFVSRFLPSDTCKLYKWGKKLRLDCTLGDMSLAQKSSAASSSSSSPATNSSTASQATAAAASSMSPFNWQRGDFTFIFDIERIGSKSSILFMDHKRQVYMNLIDNEAGLSGMKASLLADERTKQRLVDKEVDMLMSKEQLHVSLNTKNATFTPSQVGWFSKRDRIEPLNGYMCHYYDIKHLFITSRLRSEHLSDDEVRRNEERQEKLRKQLMNGKALTGDNASHKSIDVNDVALEGCADHNDDNDDDGDDDDDDDVEHRPSLEPPDKSKVPTWDEYVRWRRQVKPKATRADASHAQQQQASWPTVGRQMRVKETQKEFKAQLAMSKEFPLSIADLNKLLDALAPLAKFRKLKEFIGLKLPPGFPVRIEIPIVPTVSAKVNFLNFRREVQFGAELFSLPSHYAKEELLLFNAPSSSSADDK